jgi:cell division protein FtsX
LRHQRQYPGGAVRTYGARSGFRTSERLIQALRRSVVAVRGVTGHRGVRSWFARWIAARLAAFVGFLMGTGAVFAAMNTMYTIVANRTREVGTWRALGFPRITVLLAFVLEGLLLALAGGTLGCLLSLVMDLVSASTTAPMGEISFAFRVTPTDLGYGLLFAAAMGIIGSFLPALRAARVPIVSALHQSRFSALVLPLPAGVPFAGGA